MNTLISTSLKLQSFHHLKPPKPLKPKTNFPNPKKQTPFSLSSSHTQNPSTQPSNQEPTFTAFDFEAVVEKDWSFLEPQENHTSFENFDRIISAGFIGKDTETETRTLSKVVVSLGCEAFVDRLVELKGSFCEVLLVVHEALLVLACVKEKHDVVKCWHGELVLLPEKWDPFDVVFLYFLPGLPFELCGIFASLAKRCSSGARVVISHPQGREMLEQQKKQHPDIVVSDLPDKVALEKAANEHSFSLTEFVDEPDFFLAVLKFSA